ncbi:MAG: acyl-CoA dehydrogenase family protein [Pseudomonadota bacterium]
MISLEHLNWPFFDSSHAEFAESLSSWAQNTFKDEPHHEGNVDEICRERVRQLGENGWLSSCVADASGGFDARHICLLREVLAYHDGLADFALAMQGLGSGAISLFGSAEQRQGYLNDVAAGKKIAGFALSEPDAGSDVAAMNTQATDDGDHYVINGTKTWISNGGIADFYCLFARTTPGEKRNDGTTKSSGISAFIIDSDTPGFDQSERINVIAPHPLATLKLDNCRVPKAHLIGEVGAGFKIAMSTLDVFRTSVAAAALGFAKRALDEALGQAKGRQMFGQTLADFQMAQATLADMATKVDAAALLVYRAAWQRDTGGAVTKQAAMAKMTATESAQWVIDQAVQMFGGRGVVSGAMVERLYREIRSLRIYEGATEVQKLIISKQLLG